MNYITIGQLIALGADAHWTAPHRWFNDKGEPYQVEKFALSKELRVAAQGNPAKELSLVQLQVQISHGPPGLPSDYQLRDAYNEVEEIGGELIRLQELRSKMETQGIVTAAKAKETRRERHRVDISKRRAQNKQARKSRRANRKN